MLESKNELQFPKK